MKALLIVTASAETATGLALAGVTPLAISLLLGGSLDTPATLVVARMTGAALISLLRLYGIGLWPTVVLHAAMATWCIACLRNRPVLQATTVNLN
jgi:hypothetical protein